MADRLSELAASFEAELSCELGEASIGTNIEVTADGVISDSLARLARVEGVTGVVVMSADGRIARTTLDHAEASRRGLPALELQRRAQALLAGEGRPSGPSGGGEVLRSIVLRSRKEEMVLTCSEQFALLAVQKQQGPS